MFAETLEMKKTPYQETEFGDPGMDDEMIQTNQIGSIPADETAKYQTSVNFQNDEAGRRCKNPAFERERLEEIYPSEQTSESPVQTVYELAEEQAEPETVDEQTEDFASEAKIEDQGLKNPTTKFQRKKISEQTSEEFSADMNRNLLKIKIRKK